jgi:MFS family permease
VVAKAADDWSLMHVVPVLSAVLAVQGLSAALLGPWQDRVGPRASSMLGALFFGGGFILGGLGVATHSLPLLYVGCGLLGGCGIGFSYVPPVAALLRWFPDRRGLASGMTIMGFGGGALLVSPVKMALLHHFARAPEFVGPVEDVHVVLENGRRCVASASGQLREVVVATAGELANSVSFAHLDPGVYLVGTGSTGAAAALTTMGLGYLAVMGTACMAYREPPPGYTERVMAGAAAKQAVSSTTSAQASVAPTPAEATVLQRGERFVPIEDIMRTPQFWGVWVTFGSLACTGVGVIAVAKTMMGDIFGGALPELVTDTFSTTFVAAVSAANLSGRLVWSTVSDFIGRKSMFAVFCVGSIPLFLLVPYTVEQVAHGSGSVMPLVLFYGSTVGIISFFGGAYAATPAYEADLFGAKNVGASHGRMLTSSAVASVAGPMAITYQREKASDRAIEELVELVDEDTFRAVFQVGKEQSPALLQNKLLSIDGLMQIAPPDTVDPTPFLYNDSMYAAAGLLSVATVVNFMIRPVNEKYCRYEPLPTATTTPASSAPTLQSPSHVQLKNKIQSAEVPDGEVLRTETAIRDNAKVL